jgi:hypothetical protein
MQIGEAKPKRWSNKQLLLILSGIVLLVLVIVIVNAGIINLTSLVSSTDDIQKVEADVRSMIILDPQEKPTIASILDIDKIRSQNPEFYANARNGDYLIVFSDKAIIYRAQDRILVNVFPILSTETSPNQN